MIVKLFVLTVSAAAAGTDIRYRKISNRLIVFGLISGVVLRIFFPLAFAEDLSPPLTFLTRPSFDAEVFLEGLSGAVIPFILLYFFFLKRLIGAGDIKLFCVIGLLIGPEAVLICMLVTFAGAFLVSFALSAAAGSLEKLFKRNVPVAVYAFFSLLFYAGGVYQ